MAKWWEELPDILQPHDKCSGTGLIMGQSDPDCGGTGEVPVLAHAHTQAEFFIKYVLYKLLKVESTLDIQDTKLDTLETQLDIIESKIDQLLP